MTRHLEIVALERKLIFLTVGRDTAHPGVEKLEDRAQGDWLAISSHPHLLTSVEYKWTMAIKPKVLPPLTHFLQ